MSMLWTVDDHDVEKMLDDVIRFLSPNGAMAFLQGVIGPYLSKRAGDRFKDEGDDVVGKWQELHPATVAIREAGNWPVGGDHPINRRSGELENWVVQGGWAAYPTALGASMQYPKNRPTGELKHKVTVAQSGEGRTPARPVLGVNEADLMFFTMAYGAAFEEAGQ